MIDFKSGSPKLTYFNINYALTPSSMISDPSGGLAFYSNGCHLIGENHQIMKDGSPLSPGKIFDDYCIDWGYPVWQSVVSLPIPNLPSRYGVFHVRVEYINNVISITDLLYSEVDMIGEAKAVKKNILLVKDSFVGNISAVRHGNGRDWWVMTRNSAGTRYCLLLLTPTGIEGPFFQNSDIPMEKGYPAQIIFSPDGNWLGDCRGKGLIRLARFDRCTGEIYDEQTFDFQGDKVDAAGISFSPNSKLMYVSSPLKIYQYNLMAVNIPASRQVVAEYDGFKYKGVWTTFFQAMLAPDNKIYLTSTNSSWYLHIIHHPDSIGTACTVEQHGLKLIGNHTFNIPNFPHFRLYDLHGRLAPRCLHFFFPIC